MDVDLSFVSLLLELRGQALVRSLSFSLCQSLSLTHTLTIFDLFQGLFRCANACYLLSFFFFDDVLSTTAIMHFHLAQPFVSLFISNYVHC